MSAIDIEPLLMQISPEAPSGSLDLRDDPAFGRLENLTKGTPAIYMDKEIVEEAKAPDWRKVQAEAVTLLRRSHDLGIAVMLTRAWLHTSQLKGLEKGLALICGLVDTYWNTLYPRLDPGDDNDPTQRSSILEQMNAEDFLGALKRIPLCASRILGHPSYREILIAGGKLKPIADESAAKMNTEQIEAAFKDTAPEVLSANRTAIEASLTALAHMQTILAEKISDSGKRPKLDKLRDTLVQMLEILKHYSESSDADPAQSSALQKTDPFPSIKKKGSAEVIRDRQEVIHLLDQICTYYQSNEPTSPVPLLLKRARRLVNKNFVEIIEDLAPDSAKKIKSLISGAD